MVCPADVAAKFEAVTVGALIQEQIESQLGQEHCTELHSALKQAIASGSMLTAVKRAMAMTRSVSVADRPSGGLAQKNAELRYELDCMRQSTSWRITAPLRALARWLRIGKARA